jgi:hypothetical protein
VQPLPDPPTAEPLTDAQRDAVVHWVYARGYQRKRRQSRFDEMERGGGGAPPGLGGLS